MSKPLRLKVEVYITDRDDVVCGCVCVLVQSHFLYTLYTLYTP